MSKGLGRLYIPDERDKNFRVTAILPSVISADISKRYWNASGWWGDQGDTPQCVGYAWAHWLEDGPVTHAGNAPIVDPSVIYHEAQKRDFWEGENYDGTSVRAGAKYLKEIGLISGYRWAFTLNEVIQAVLTKGPVVMGTNWYEGMFEPDKKAKVSISGSIAGGHAWKLDGIDIKNKIARGKNNWGREWGRKGFFYLSFTDLERLISERGEACLAEEVKA